MKTYTAYQLWKQRLLYKPDGFPYTDKESIPRKLKSLGIEKTATSENGTLIYEISEKQLKNINNYITGRTKTLIR